MVTFNRPFFTPVAFSVRTGTIVCTTAGVGVVMVGVIVGELEFLAFVFLIVGILHPATTTKLTIMKRVRGLIIF
jgi:hypothetical protein